MKPHEFVKSFNARYSLRLHMSVLLSLMLVSAFGLNKVLLFIGVDHFMVRYGMVTVLSYLSFFVYLKLWILCLFPNRKPRLTSLREEALSKGIDIWPNDSSPFAPDNFRGEGGQYSGAGASAAWSADGHRILPDISLPGLDLDEGSAPLVIPLVLIFFATLAVFSMLVVCGTLIFTAPTMLGEVALEAALGIGLARRLDLDVKAFKEERWLRRVLRKTVLLFLFVLLANFGLAWAAMHYFPEAKSVMEIFRLWPA